MKRNYTTFKNSRGLTLVELMVAMAVSAVLMVGISEVFSLNKKSYGTQDENSRMQESGRYAFNMLMTDIRRAGFFGGNAHTDQITGTAGAELIKDPNNVASSVLANKTCVSTTTDWARMIERPFYGLDDGNEVTDGDNLAVNYTGCIPDTEYTRGDILVTRYTKSPLISDTTLALAENANRLYITNSLFIGRLYQGSDWDHADNVVLETPKTTREIAARAYYVGPSGRNCRFNDADNNPIPIPSLLREVLNDSGLPVKEEVANGVEHIQFQYGIDSNGDESVNRYYNANELSNDSSITPNWAGVVTVRFWVLVRANCPSTNYSNTKTYVMGNNNYTVNDNFKRQLYSSTVSSRN